MLTNKMAPICQWVFQHGMTNVVLCIKLSKQINPKISQLYRDEPTKFAVFYHACLVMSHQDNEWS